MAAPATPMRPSSLACDICRKRHLKCDGHPQAICSRCNRIGSSCTYTASKRGHNRKRQSAASPLSVDTSGSRHDSLQASDTAANIAASNLTDTSTSVVAHEVPCSADEPVYRPSNGFSGPAPSCMGITTTPVDRDHLLDVYYQNFAPAHPLLVSQSVYHLQRYPSYLETVVLHIGRLYVGSSSQQEIRLAQGTITTQLRELHRVNTPSIHYIQALTLLGIILHAQYHPADAQWCLSTAMQLALDIGLNTAAITIGEDPTITESLRYTWWELWIADVYLAALHRRQPSYVGLMQEHPPLPGNELAPHATPTLAELKSSVFQEIRPQFSSAAHRAEALCVIERLLALDTHAAVDDVQAIDNAITAWRLNLPASKSSVMDSAGEIDEMLFQAYCYNYCACIFLHFPRSDLPATVPTTATISGGKEYRRFASASSYHTAKAIVASKELCNLAALPCAAGKHSPLFSCALILACIVQLAAASVHLGEGLRQCQQQHFDRVALLMGTLDTLGQRWAVARHAVRRLRPIAALIFSTVHAPNMNEYTVDEVAIDDFSSISWLNILDFDPLQEDLMMTT